MAMNFACFSQASLKIKWEKVILRIFHINTSDLVGVFLWINATTEISRIGPRGKDEVSEAWSTKTNIINLAQIKK
jgi:hypothetical protein